LLLLEKQCMPNILAARFTWSLPPRLPVGDDGVIVESQNTDKTDALLLDGCTSTSGDLRYPLTTYQWRVTDGAKALPSPPAGCHSSLQRPLKSAWTTWTITLTITRADGKHTSFTQNARFRDLLIASLGDSAASGEGVPDRPGEYQWTLPQYVKALIQGHTFVPKQVVPVRWANDGGAQCDRSGNAASAQAAAYIQGRDPGTSVTFWHLACSGAAIVCDQFDCSDGNGGLLTPYDGENKGSPRLKPQVDQLADLEKAAGRQVDALLLTAGADDVDWAHVLKVCYAVNKGPFVKSCEKRYDQSITNGLNSLYDLPKHPGLFTQLAQRLQQLNIAAPGHVFLTEYWDPTVDNRGGIYNGHGFSRYCQQDNTAPGADDRRWGHDTILAPLNRAVDAAAGTEHWKLVGGIGDAFRGHGLCSTPDQSWIVSWEDSETHQGTENGGWHANELGQEVISKLLLKSMSNVLGTPTA
jgi:hypothetical protein